MRLLCEGLNKSSVRDLILDRNNLGDDGERVCCQTVPGLMEGCRRRVSVRGSPELQDAAPALVTVGERCQSALLWRCSASAQECRLEERVRSESEY